MGSYDYEMPLDAEAASDGVIIQQMLTMVRTADGDNIIIRPCDVRGCSSRDRMDQSTKRYAYHPYDHRFLTKKHYYPDGSYAEVVIHQFKTKCGKYFSVLGHKLRIAAY
jgi:hypothetical protein